MTPSQTLRDATTAVQAAIAKLERLQRTLTTEASAEATNQVAINSALDELSAALQVAINSALDELSAALRELNAELTRAAFAANSSRLQQGVNQ